MVEIPLPIVDLMAEQLCYSRGQSPWGVAADGVQNIVKAKEEIATFLEISQLLKQYGWALQ